MTNLELTEFEQTIVDTYSRQLLERLQAHAENAENLAVIRAFMTMAIRNLSQEHHKRVSQLENNLQEALEDLKDTTLEKRSNQVQSILSTKANAILGRIRDVFDEELDYKIEWWQDQ